MKKTVLTFGLISGVLLSAMMALTVPFQHDIGLDKAEVIGYTTMVLASLLIFFGVRSYRDNVAGGRIKFGRAFAVGALIGAVSAACYVATWEVMYFNFMPDFLDKYQALTIERARADGASEQEIVKEKARLEKFAQLYQNPLINSAMTFLEPLPVVLVMSFVSAGILSRRRRKEDMGEAATVGVA